MNKKYNYDNLAFICSISYSYSECLRKLGIKFRSGHVQTLKRKIKKQNIDISHFHHQKGSSWNKGKTFPDKHPLEDYLSNKRPIKSDSLKKKLIKAGIFENKCYKCQNTKWLGEPIPLDLHHIDNNHNNNNLDNLTIICANCHRVTHIKPKTKKKIEKHKLRKVIRPSKEELSNLLINNTWVSVGKMYGVSDNAIRKWAKDYNIPLNRKSITIQSSM